ncbi:MAG TPA: ABC transporter substrate-binding protein [Pseudomonadales bacterium]|nr:ABC transporter substrate-binding protein [Pseudomonadales bacterium]
MRNILLSAMLFLSCTTHVVSANVSPEQVIASATDEVMIVITEAKGYYEKEPDRYFNNIAVVLDKFVDFDDFSRAVMGGFASEKRLSSLTDVAERTRAEEQIERFSAVFKAGLVQTYGKGFLAFGGEKVEIADSRLSPDGNDAQVLQLVHGIAEKPYEIRYTLRKNDAGEWKLRNVIIEAINLGKIYRNQFMSAARKYSGDIDQVIDNWVVEEATI